jgi:hypothetical protein
MWLSETFDGPLFALTLYPTHWMMIIWRWDGGYQFSNCLPELPAPLANERNEAMKDLAFEQLEEEILNFEVSDEALETVGDAKNQNAFTLGACTGLSVCPG